VGPLVVPMNPEFLPEGAMLLAGAVAAGVALHSLLTRQMANGMKAGAISVVCVGLAFLLAGTHKSVRLNPRRGIHEVPATSPAARDTFPGPPTRRTSG